VKRTRFQPFLLLTMGLLVGCATFGQESTWDPLTQRAAPNRLEQQALLAAQSDEDTSGGLVLTTAEQMLQEGVVVIGSCWDYIDKVYRRAGFTDADLVRVYSQPYAGPFADPALIQKGDWVMYQNLSYGNIDHSAIFVGWVDFDRTRALTVSYVGQNRAAPGRLYEYDLSRTYRILRPQWD